MKVALPSLGSEYNTLHMRELVRRLESAFANVLEDQRRGAITVMSDYTMQREDSLVMVAPVAAGVITVTVPDVASWMIDQKWSWHVKLIAAGTLIVAPVSDTIDGSTDATTTTVNTALEIRATNDGWKII